MVFVLGLWYLRKADREFDPLADRVLESAAEAKQVRFERGEEERAEAVR